MRLSFIFMLCACLTQAQTPNLDWNLKYKWLISTVFFGCSVDSKGDCILSGGSWSSGKGISTRTATFIRKYDSWGRLKWADSSSLASNVAATGVAVDRFDNVYQIASTANTGGVTWGGKNYGPFALYLLKYSPEGKLLWVKQIVGGGAMAMDIMISNDDLYVFGAGSLTKLDLEGNKYFTVGTLTFRASVDKSGRICLSDKLCDKDGKLIKTYERYYWNRICDLDGNTYCYYNDSLAKFDPADNLVWARNVPEMSKDEFSSTIHLEDDKIYIASEVSDSSTKYFKVLSFTTAGDFRWQYDYGLPNFGNDAVLKSRNIASHKGHVLVSGCYGPMGGVTALSIKLREPGAELVGVQEEPTTSLLEIFPNPGRHFIVKGDLSQYSSYKITDANGKLIIGEKLENCAEALQIDMSRHPQGVYMLSISGKESTQHHKLVVD